MKAEVDEYGMLCVKEGRGASWVEAFVRVDVLPEGVVPEVHVDAEDAPSRSVNRVIYDAVELWWWCTKGGKAPWLKKSEPTTRSTLGSSTTA